MERPDEQSTGNVRGRYVGVPPDDGAGTGALRIALAQINLCVGDIEGNAERIIAEIDRAAAGGADIVVFPELAVTGYPPEDLLLKPSFVEHNMRALERIAGACKDLAAVVGFAEADSDIYNAAAVIRSGSVAGVHRKNFLPNYGVFDEMRYFRRGRGTNVYRLGSVLFGVSVCEDIWYPEGPHREQAICGGASVLININASPFHSMKWKWREAMLATRASDNGAYVVYLNLVGGQDELVFDGHSMVFDPSGRLIARGRSFEEEMIFVDLDPDIALHTRLSDTRWRQEACEAAQTQVGIIDLGPASGGARPPIPDGKAGGSEVAPPDRVEEVYGALILGTRDYVRKNGFEGVVIGLSGGIDSALTAVIAADAIGPERVTAVSMPSVFSSEDAKTDAETLARNLGIRFLTLPIQDLFEGYKAALAPAFHRVSGDLKPPSNGADVTEENIQARIRGNYLMALSNKFRLLVLTTGNKSELATGYATLYGDMAGGFSVLKDVPKTLVYELSRYRNSRGAVIPAGIIERAPSAELRADQKDSDTLPPYDVLDPILHLYIEDDFSPSEIVRRGYPEEVVRRVVAMVDRNEYKRRQSAPGIKITPKAFGRDRRLPITNRFQEW